MHNNRFEWVNMIGIYVLVAPGATSSTHKREIMVIIDRQGKFHAHEFISLAITLKKFCALVEYFRNRSRQT